MQEQVKPLRWEGKERGGEKSDGHMQKRKRDGGAGNRDADTPQEWILQWR